MFRFGKIRPLLAVLVAAAILGAPTHARASYAVQVYDDGVLQGGIFTFVSGNSLLFVGSTTHFSLTSGTGSSNNPGSQGGSMLSLSNNETVTSNFGSTGGTHTIKIVLSQDTWTAPTGTPLVLSSSGGGSLTYSGGTNPTATQSVTATYQGFLDNSNTLFGMPGGAGTPLQTATATLNTIGSTAPLVFSPGVSVNPNVPGGTPFALTDVLELTFTLGAGSGQTAANISATTNVNVAAVPAPAGLLLALSSIPCLGIGAWIRRRRQPV